MPRIRQKDSIYRDADFSRAVKCRLTFLGLQQHDLANELGISDGSCSLMLKNPERIPINRLRKIISYLGMAPEDILIFCGYNKKQIGGTNYAD